MSKLLRTRLTPYYSSRWDSLKEELSFSDAELLKHLIDSYYLDTASDLRVLHTILSRRIRRGVDYSFLLTLDSINCYISHFLNKVRRI